MTDPRPAARAGRTGPRRRGRELALQRLYEMEVRGEADPAPGAADFWARRPAAPAAREFADRLVRGAKAHQGEIDALIARFSEHWELERTALVDRNILRVAIFELRWGVEVPPGVVIDEAIEIARRYSTEEATRFINGLLDRVRRELGP